MPQCAAKRSMVRTVVTKEGTARQDTKLASGPSVCHYLSLGHPEPSCSSAWPLVRSPRPGKTATVCGARTAGRTRGPVQIILLMRSATPVCCTTIVQPAPRRVWILCVTQDRAAPAFWCMSWFRFSTSRTRRLSLDAATAAAAATGIARDALPPNAPPIRRQTTVTCVTTRFAPSAIGSCREKCGPSCPAPLLPCNTLLLLHTVPHSDSAVE